MMRTLLGILEQLTRIYSSPQISGHLLEFVSSISREHQLYANFHTKDYTTLFAVAINYIQFHNNQRRRESSTSVQNVALSQYVFIMAYQIIDVFFLSLPTRLKSEVVDHIVMGLLRANYSRTSLDEANAVCLDMILKNYNRSSDEILKLADAVFAEDLGSVVERSWLQHNAIVTIRAQRRGLLAQIIVRSASGTTLRMVDLPAEVRKKYAERIELPPMSPPISPTTDSPSSSLGPALLLGELVTNNAAMSRAAHLPISFGPAPCLAQEFITAYPGLQNIDPPELLPSGAEAIARSIRVFDTMNTVDTYKVSVVYVGPGQTTEREILLNQQGSPVYWNFLRGLGTITRLSGMKGFSASLDTSGNDEDGRYTIRWRDLVSQLVFHVGTLMPAREDKHEQIIRKKAHMANDYVQIVFNESGRDYEFDTIPSQFNYVQIIVTPNDKTMYVQLYKVMTQVNPSVPFYGPAIEPKLLTLTALPAFVRSIAIHAAILSNVFSSCKKADSSAAELSRPGARGCGPSIAFARTRSARLPSLLQRRGPMSVATR
ncbi:hypothetical protein BX661DRAFT_154749 [Kickxella alabastrina]|uniref:uncharacterized protein n=1 Tax=Kickxella alabastrina TaxID=61397 RepID=UPI00221EC5F9|nr:uncharacterized protein BX661DRAFT_154749 [Kickxella alabastrina]KAI7825517.1 hypothetical protein BX661DRAFT_154749 [Kickxella alabastrina]